MIGDTLQEHDCLPSTNAAALDWVEAPHGAAILAHSQSAGRGRLGRTWVSPLGKGLYLSVVIFPASGVTPAQISLSTGLAVVRALHQAAALKALIKWPNDILVADGCGELCKIGGILCETRADEGAGRLVVGLGLNLNHGQEDFPERNQFPATSLRKITGKTWTVHELLGPLFTAWTEVDRRLASGEWPQLLLEINQLSAGMGEPIKVQSGGKVLVGMQDSIDMQGRLMLRTAEGTVPVMAGDVSYF